MKIKTIAIGNAPSSGSTLLADLLDSTNFSAVGPELNLFSLKQLYDFSTLKSTLFKSSKVSSVYLNRCSLISRDLSSYGLDKSKLEGILDNSSSLEDFLNNFSKHFLSLRGKSIDGVVFEKTPQNMMNVGNYLKCFDSYFIHIVRNPIDIYKSLLKRGIPHSIALITWLIEESHIFPYLNHPKVIVIKYEDLIENPFAKVAYILKKILNKSIDINEIKYNYENNIYRKFHSRKLSSWENQSFGKVELGNPKILTEDDIENLKILTHLKVSQKYGDYFNLAPVSFIELLTTFNYKTDYFNKIGENQTHNKFKLDSESFNFLQKKFFSDIKYFDSSILDYTTYINPVEHI